MTTPPPDLSKLRIERRTAPRSVRRALVRNLVLAAAALGVIAVVLGYARARGVPEVQAVVVSAASGSPAPGAGATAVTANGYVVARTKAAVAAKIPGRLATLTVSEGSFVRVGDIIARLENADYEAQVSQAEANLATARASLIEAEADRDQLRREAERQRSVRAQNQQLVSAQDLELAESRAAQAEARVNAARARADAAEAGLRLARATLENTFIRAPFTGTVLRKEAEVGEVVAPSVGGGLTRGAVVTMADLTTLEVEVDVNEAYIGRITSAMAARITLDAYPDTSFRGRVRQVVPTADRQRATVQVKVSILQRDPRILPEMGAKVDFLEPDTAAALPGGPPRFRIPTEAVRDVQGQAIVWLIRDGRLSRRDVEAGPASAGFREIRTGLNGGELVLLSGVESPSEGLRVAVATPR